MKLEMFQEIIEGLGKTLEPDQDWMPMLIMEDAIVPKEGESLKSILKPTAEAGGRGNIMIALAVGLDTQEEKNMVASIIRKLIVDCRPASACFISTAWSTHNEEDMAKAAAMAGTGEAFKVSESPNKIECVFCLCIGRKGESDGEVIMNGEIERSDGPPKIKAWEIIDDPGLTSGGRFSNAMHEAFNVIGDSNEKGSKA